MDLPSTVKGRRDGTDIVGMTSWSSTVICRSCPLREATSSGVEPSSVLSVRLPCPSEKEAASESLHDTGLPGSDAHANVPVVGDSEAEPACDIENRGIGLEGFTSPALSCERKLSDKSELLLFRVGGYTVLRRSFGKVSGMSDAMEYEEASIDASSVKMNVM